MMRKGEKNYEMRARVIQLYQSTVIELLYEKDDDDEMFHTLQLLIIILLFTPLKSVVSILSILYI